MKRVLIANRGEIACRIAKTCRRLGIESVAVYSDDDKNALHVTKCDAAIHIGASAVTQSYLNIAAVIQAALDSRADAVHPGYGFLSENAEFAERVEAAGLTFIGPRPEIIRMMGDKLYARRQAAALGIPVPPGSYQRVASLDEGVREAARIGYPLLVKARKGGGGIGMTVVRAPHALQAALESAGRRARRAFGSEHVYVERYFEDPRHVEVQIFGDGRGTVLALGDRDCSSQRRHQKVIEEAPAPRLSTDERMYLSDSAVALAQAVNYRGAGTVEFLRAADGSPHFLEMNTRLQVEHPVTEAVTGLDLVEWQLRVADGQSLSQLALSRSGHAIECRLYAEDPRTMIPSPGHIDVWQMPDSRSIRVDTGYGAGMDVSRHYDPLLAKLIAWGPDRESARTSLIDALLVTEVTGVKTNLSSLRELLEHDRFIAADHSTTTLSSLRA